jgi:hypothetical protein
MTGRLGLGHLTPVFFFLGLCSLKLSLEFYQLSFVSSLSTSCNWAFFFNGKKARSEAIRHEMWIDCSSEKLMFGILGIQIYLLHGSVYFYHVHECLCPRL